MLNKVIMLKAIYKNALIRSIIYALLIIIPCFANAQNSYSKDFSFAEFEIDTIKFKIHFADIEIKHTPDPFISGKVEINSNESLNAFKIIGFKDSNIYVMHFYIPKESKAIYTGHIKMQVPDSIYLDIKTTLGSIDMEKLTLAGAFLRTAKGIITIKDCNFSGSINSLYSNISLLNINGDISVFSNSGHQKIIDHKGPLYSDALTGTLNLMNYSGKAYIKRTSGSIKIHDSNGNFRIKSSSGDAFLGNVSGNLSLTTTSGPVRVQGMMVDSLIDIENKIGSTNIVVKNSEEHTSYDLHTKTGSIFMKDIQYKDSLVNKQGFPLIKANSVDGSIKLFFR